ncbi:hypothetical protein ACH9L7_10200 [Haloferax sp. S1W]|uniref:hypothetical protein n=1 Tax=Haloferax sp. S1W TaxID=3377110 RepID=UPI0037C9F09F
MLIQTFMAFRNALHPTGELHRMACQDRFRKPTVGLYKRLTDGLYERRGPCSFDQPNTPEWSD